MNLTEKKSINQIEYAKNDIKKAKLYHDDAIKNMDSLDKFIATYIKVDVLKNISSDISKYKKYMRNQNDELEKVINSLEKDIDGIKKAAAEREAAEKREEERRKREEAERKEKEEAAKKAN